jgi:hypothetical protein
MDASEQPLQLVLAEPVFRRASSAPFNAFVEAAIRSIAV